MLEEIKRRIAKYNGSIKFDDDFVVIYGNIKKSKKPDSLLGYVFDDKFDTKEENGFIKWKGKMKKDDLINKENNLKSSIDKNSEGKKRKKFKIKKREKRKRKTQVELNEFKKLYNN